MIKLGLSILLTLAFVLPASSADLAEEFTCRGSLGTVTVDHLRVPQNASCILNGTKVKGTIKVEATRALQYRAIRSLRQTLIE